VNDDSKDGRDSASEKSGQREPVSKATGLSMFLAAVRRHCAQSDNGVFSQGVANGDM